MKSKSNEMKSNELKLGNYFYGFSKDFQIVEALYPEFLYLKNPDGSTSYSYDELKPIPLTENWLKRFGIKKLKLTGYIIGATYWKKDGIVFYEKNDKYYLAIGEKLQIGNQAIVFDKVHELQNIFALTGKELISK